MTNQKNYPDLGSDASSVYGISVLVSHTSFCRETSGGVLKCQLFSQANKICEGLCFIRNCGTIVLVGE